MSLPPNKRNWQEKAIKGLRATTYLSTGEAERLFEAAWQDRTCADHEMMISRSKIVDILGDKWREKLLSIKPRSLMTGSTWTDSGDTFYYLNGEVLRNFCTSSVHPSEMAHLLAARYSNVKVALAVLEKLAKSSENPPVELPVEYMQEWLGTNWQERLQQTGLEYAVFAADDRWPERAVFDRAMLEAFARPKLEEYAVRRAERGGSAESQR